MIGWLKCALGFHAYDPEVCVRCGRIHELAQHKSADKLAENTAFEPWWAEDSVKNSGDA